MNKIYKHPLLCLLLGVLVFQCTRKESIFDDGREITFEDGVLECKECVYFAYLVELDQNSLFISGNDELFCMEYKGADWELTQSIKNEGEVLSITVGGDHLFLGIMLPDGEGVVKVFEKQAGLWTEVQELSAENQGDNFGAVMAYDDGHLLVGTDASQAIPTAQEASGGIYFFQKKDGVWAYQKGFDFHDLGKSVALKGSYSYAGTQKGLYSFYFDGSNWSRRDSFPFLLSAEKLCLEGNQLFVKTGFNFQPLRAFEVENGQITAEKPVHYDDVKDLEVLFHGDVIKMQDNYVAVGIDSWDMDHRGGLMLLEYKNRGWSVAETYLPPAQANRSFAHTFAISDHWVAIGDSYSYNGKVFLYKRHR